MSNIIYKKELNSIKNAHVKKKMISLDFSLVQEKKIKIFNQDIKEDTVYIQSYIVKNFKLYRLESLHEFKEYPFNFNNEFVPDYLGEVNSFRVYKSNNQNESYLINIDFKRDEDILCKVKILE